MLPEDNAREDAPILPNRPYSCSVDYHIADDASGNSKNLRGRPLGRLSAKSAIGAEYARQSPPPIPGRAFRAKKARVQRWLVLHAVGSKQILTLDKRQLVQSLDLDVPSRDMRLLDTNFSQYENIGQVSVNNQSIVFSMEHVKLIVTADKVIVPLEDEKNQTREQFVLYLEEKVKEHSSRLCPQVEHSMAHEGTMNRTASNHHEHEVPFELHVLETALGEICNHLAWEVDTLQSQAQPVLEELTKDADTPVLERVRRIKTGHQRLMGRVQLVRDVLHRLMEDDGDMLRMCLTAHQLQGQRQASLAAPPGPGQAPEALAGRMSRGASAPQAGLHHAVSNDGSSASVEAAEPSSLFQGRLASDVAFSSLQSMIAKNVIAKSLRRHVLTIPNLESFDHDELHDLLDVENLLESYFMLVDSTCNSLVSIGEYIDDTEDLINIQLDYSRNKLIRFDIVLTAAAFSLGIFNCVAGMLGENLVLPEFITVNIWGFVLVNITVLLISGLSFYAIVSQLVKKKIL